jgi:glycerol-3-phosphate responsive antiterminator
MVALALGHCAARVHFPGAAKSNIASSISAADEHTATEASNSSCQQIETDFAELKDGTVVEIVEDIFREMNETVFSEGH